VEEPAPLLRCAVVILLLLYSSITQSRNRAGHRHPVRDARGRPSRPGLHLKIPVIQEVLRLHPSGGLSSTPIPARSHQGQK